jgi:hypothetical protein
VLRDFLSANREELIRRCATMVGERQSPAATPGRPGAQPRFGVPLFLDQLGEALQRRHADGFTFSKAASIEGSRTASLHGEQMQEEGYTVEQVVHDYGDVCQAITELARQQGTPVSVHEFQILNRLLDNAIADAVSSYETNRDLQGDVDLHQRLGTLAEEQRRHLDVALKAFDALKVGNIGVMGATGTLLEDSLMKLRELIDKSHPELRLSSGMAKPPPG